MRRLSPCELPLTDWQREERYLYSGKELERGKGLMLYDFHARQYDPQLGRFTSPDPLRGDYPGLDPYLYCAANPISFTDPTGMKIELAGNEEYQMLLYTLPYKAWKYVWMNEVGVVDSQRINSAPRMESANFDNLKSMANSEQIINITLSDKYTYNDKNGNSISESLYVQEIDPLFSNEEGRDLGSTMLGEPGRTGVTLFPNSQAVKQSLSEKTEVYISKDLSEFGKSEILSHELHGHAFIYYQTSDPFLSSHKVVKSKETNELLKESILNSKIETVRNIKSLWEEMPDVNH